MIKNIKIFDCTLRECGYQTGWFYDKKFAQTLYKFAQGKGIDYIELGFFHNELADPEKGNFRYCSARQKEIADVFKHIKNRTKISAMRDIQRPLADLVPAKDGVVDAIRILTRSHETDLNVLGAQIEEVRDSGYEVFVNFTSAGYNTIEQNNEFIEFVISKGVDVIYFADTESVMTSDYVTNTIQACHDAGIKAGMHFHDKNGSAEILADTAIRSAVDFVDVTHLGLGGKWRDGNLTMEYILNKISAGGGFELTNLKNELIEQLIAYSKCSVAE